MSVSLSIHEDQFIADVRHAILCMISPDSDMLIFAEANGLAPYGQGILYPGQSGSVPIPVPVPVIKGQDNRTSMPPADPGFIVLTPIANTRLATNVESYVDGGHYWDGSESLTESIQFDLQIDCYGENSGDWARILSIFFRSEFGVRTLKTCAPLYADDPTQTPLINGEEQYESRWTLRASFEYDPSITLPMQFADVLADPVVTIYQES